MTRCFIALCLVCVTISVAAAQNFTAPPMPMTTQSELAPNVAADQVSSGPTQTSNRFSAFLWKLVFISIVLLTILGIAYGITNRAVFYMDRNDMIYSCTPYISIIIGGFLAMMTDWKFLFWIGFIVAIVLFFSIINKSFQYNQNKLISISTAVAKLALSFLVVIQVFNALAPSGSSTSRQRYNRNSSLVWLLFLMPVVYVLINGEKVLAARKALDAENDLVPVSETK